MATADNLAQARDALRRRGWTDGYRLLAAADRDEPLELDDLERLATAAYLIGKDAESTEFWARAHQEFLGLGAVDRAVRCAFWHLHADLPPHEVHEEHHRCVALSRAKAPARRRRITLTETLEKTLQVMDRYNIVRAFLGGVDPAIVQTWMAAAAPDRFIAAPFILQPGRPDPEVLRKAYAAGRFRRSGRDRHAAHRCAAERPGS